MGALTLTGCETYEVSVCRQPAKVCGPADLAGLPGVPFNSKVPERAHYTKWLAPFDTITVTAKLTDDKGKDVAGFQPKLPPPVYVYPHQGRADDYLLEVSRIAQGHQGPISVSDDGAATAVFNEIVGDLRPIFKKLTDEAAGIPSSGQLAGNDIETQTVIDDAVYYLNYQRPIAGSIDGQITLSADGTLSKAEGNSNDTTLASLASVAAAVVTGGASAAATAATTPPSSTAPAANKNVFFDQSFQKCRLVDGVLNCQQTSPKPPEPKEFKLVVSITITTTLQMIALKESCAANACDTAIQTVLSLCDARHDPMPTSACPSGDTKLPVQIASITPYPPPAPPASKDDSKKKKKDSKDADSKDDASDDK
jgi:hypothetical protein